MLSVHDISDASRPEWYPYRRDRWRRWFYRHSIDRARLIVVPSTFTADEIMRVYGVPSARRRRAARARRDVPHRRRRAEQRSRVLLHVGDLLGPARSPWPWPSCAATAAGASGAAAGDGSRPSGAEGHRTAERDLARCGEVDLAERLRDRGYRTALIGKWHLGRDESRSLESGLRRADRRRGRGGAGLVLRALWLVAPGRAPAVRTDAIGSPTRPEVHRRVEAKGQPFFLRALALRRPHADRGTAGGGRGVRACASRRSRRRGRRALVAAGLRRDDRERGSQRRSCPRQARRARHRERDAGRPHVRQRRRDRDARHRTGGLDATRRCAAARRRSTRVGCASRRSCAGRRWSAARGPVTRSSTTIDWFATLLEAGVWRRYDSGVDLELRSLCSRQQDAGRSPDVLLLSALHPRLRPTLDARPGGTRPAPRSGTPAEADPSLRRHRRALRPRRRPRRGSRPRRGAPR